MPLERGKFYPDFVARLIDGRLLVVEYKGAHLATGEDSAAKRAIGALWERQSEGKCLFIMVERELDGRDMRQQLTDKIGGA